MQRAWVGQQGMRAAWVGHSDISAVCVRASVPCMRAGSNVVCVHG